MSVNRYWIPVIVISTFLGAVFGSQALGWWSSSGRTSVNMDSFTPEDIKGWMTLQQVADGLQLSLEDIYRIGGIPDAIAPETALKELEEIVEVSTLREKLAEYIEAPVATEVAPPAPTPASAEPVGTPEGSSNALHTGDGTGPTPLPPGQILPADQIKGRMPLRNVSEQCGVDLAALLEALNLPSDTDPDTQLKTLTQNGVLDEVTQVQEAVAILQGQ